MLPINNFVTHKMSMTHTTINLSTAIPLIILFDTNELFCYVLFIKPLLWFLLCTDVTTYFLNLSKLKPQTVRRIISLLNNKYFV